jgi:nucleoside-diphosphate-sugar epimerase
MFAFVTGPTGFLGSHLVERLLLGGHRVRALVYGPRCNLADDSRIETLDGDITCEDSLAAALKDIDVVFHTAAVVTNWAPWSRFLATTVHGTENLLKAAANADSKRFVHISTIRVYDDRYCRRHRTVTEDAPLGKKGFRAFGRYARAKVMAEEAVWSYAKQIPVTVIRPAWIYGPRDQLILPAIARYLQSPSARWPSRHDPCADPIYVTDVADCAIAAALSPVTVGQAYHASPPGRISVRAFLGAVCGALGFEIPRRWLPYCISALLARATEWWAHLIHSEKAPAFDRAGLAILTQDIRHSPDKAEQHLGWQAKVSLFEGAAATAAWLSEHYPELRRHADLNRLSAGPLLHTPGTIPGPHGSLRGYQRAESSRAGNEPSHY